MCTVSYIPQVKGYLLTSNRDEDPGRATKSAEKFNLPNGLKVIAPRDELKGGTWIVIDEKGRSACLVNGAFDRHKRQLTYKKSRGLLAFEALEARNFNNFMEQAELVGMEPFTLLLLEPGSLFKMAWDGLRKYYWELPATTAHLWSSPTLYSTKEHADKERYFKNSVKLKGTSGESLLQIHGRDSDSPFILKKPQVCTVSITQLAHNGREASLLYHDKRNHHENTIHLTTV